jgi:hypothetical protein
LIANTRISPTIEEVFLVIVKEGKKKREVEKRNKRVRRGD